jgi:hypothetical protein
VKTKDYMAACGLPEWMDELWVCEAAVDANAKLIFHIDRLVEVLRTNDQHVANGWHTGFVPFAVCHTIKEADAACERMRKKHRALRRLRQIERRSA